MQEGLSKILYVDDESINLRSFKSLFRRKYQIFTALSGAEALDILKEESIDILVTDQMMPSMTGLELLKIVSKAYPEMMLMILTGYSEMSVIKEAINECGVYSYLNKPWEKELLERTFDRALEHQKLIREREMMIVALNEHNEELEQAVDARTEQIKLQRDELVEKNNLLEDAQEIIRQKNDQLQIYNHDLELQVQQRTQQLSDSNLKLSKSNEQLEQFAFLAAHNFRGPVATLLGLIQIMEMQTNVGKEDSEQFAQNIKSVALKLDEVIRDLSEILHKNSSDKAVELQKVDLSTVVNRVENALNAQIEKSHAKINKDLASLHEIYSDADAIENILYQLISNSLTFVPKNTAPIINIKSLKDEEHYFLIVSDEGIGIDLDMYGEKIFGVYQTFHEGIGGKGLGLFSVRNSLHRLGGHIHVESKPSQGTKFIIDLPLHQNAIASE